MHFAVFCNQSSPINFSSIDVSLVQFSSQLATKLNNCEHLNCKEKNSQSQAVAAPTILPLLDVRLFTVAGDKFVRHFPRRRPAVLNTLSPAAEDDSVVFTALHGMQMRSCDENSVRLSVRPSVRLSV